MKLTERFRRRDLGHMDIAITIDDPKEQTKHGRQLERDTANRAVRVAAAIADAAHCLHLKQSCR